MDDPLQIVDQIKESLTVEDGFELYTFKIGSYNASVDKEFKLPYNEDAMAVLIISTPDMFDVSFRRWVVEKTKELGSFELLVENVSSPIQEFLDHRLAILKETFVGHSFDVFHDHSLWPNRKPKVLMCTCGHVAGAAYYYQPKDLACNGWPPEKPMEGKSKFIGLSLHPQYAGHFAFRSVLIFPDVALSNGFQETKPVGIVQCEESARKALELFNFHWRDSRFRDIGNPKRRYSETQVKYFGTPPAERWSVIRHWVEEERERAKTN